MLADAEGGEPEVILIGTGSEVALCVAAYEQLTAEGVRARVVSMPSWELFEQQAAEYRDSVLPPPSPRASRSSRPRRFGWERYVGRDGAIIGMHTFGASAPLKELQQKFGFTPEHIVAAARSSSARTAASRQA